MTTRTLLLEDGTTMTGEAGSTESVLDLISRGGCDAVINVMDNGQDTISDGKEIRRAAIAQGIPLFTSLDTARAICRVMESRVFSTEVI